jgi:hypothetical protein
MDLAARERVADLVDGAGDRPQPFGLYALAHDHPVAELGREVERDVFLEFFGNSRELMAQEYDAYDDASVFLVVVDHRQLVVAGVERLMMPSVRGVKTLHDLERVWGEQVDDVLARSGLTFDLARVWDVSTIAIRPEYRGATSNGLISATFLQGVIQIGHACNVQYFVTTLDMVVLKLVQDLCNRPLSFFRGVEPMRYLDSPASVPCYIDMAGYTRRLRAEDPGGYTMWSEGRGFEAAMAQPDWSEVEMLRRSRAAAASGESPQPAG